MYLSCYARAFFPPRRRPHRPFLRYLGFSPFRLVRSYPLRWWVPSSTLFGSLLLALTRHHAWALLKMSSADPPNFGAWSLPPLPLVGSPSLNPGRVRLSSSHYNSIGFHGPAFLLRPHAVSFSTIIRAYDFSLFRRRLAICICSRNMSGRRSLQSPAVPGRGRAFGCVS